MKIMKIILMFVMVLFLVGTVSAVGIDYSNEDMTAHIKNTILFGLINIGEQGTMELKSHKTVDEIIQVGLGWQVTMIYDFNFGKAHKDALGDVTFTNMKNGEEVEREWKYVYQVEEEYESPTYTCAEITPENEFALDRCYISGTETLTRNVWKDYNSKDIPKDKITLGIMVFNKQGDYIDGVWEVQGKKIKKHAEWTADINVDMVLALNMDSSSGTNVIDSIGNTNFTIVGMSGLTWGTGTFGNAIVSNSTTLGQSIKYTGAILDDTTGANYSIFGLFNTSSPTDNSNILYTAGDGLGIKSTLAIENGDNCQFRNNAGGIVQTTATTTPFDQAVVNSYGCVKRGSVLESWVNGINIQNDSVTDTATETNKEAFILNSNPANNGLEAGSIENVYAWDRALSVAEIKNIIYNGGNFNAYVAVPLTPPTSTLNAPDDDVTVTNPNVQFNATGTDNVELANMSLIVNGTYISTNNSVINNTETLFAYALTSADFWNWTVEACDDEVTCVNATFRTITYANALTISLGTPANLTNSSTNIIDFTGTASDDTLLVNIKFILNDVYNETNSSPINNTLTTFTKTLADGSYTWNMEACDTYACVNGSARNITIDTTPFIQFETPTPVTYANLTSNPTLNVSLTETYFQNITFNINGSETTYTDTTRSYNPTLADGHYKYNVTVWTSTGQNNITETRTLTKDSTNPSSTITAPETPIAFQEINENMFFNWTANDTHLDSCWYNYESVNTSLTCGDGTTNVNITGSENTTIILYVNDTFGNLNTSSITWIYTFFQSGKSFSSSAYETDDEMFSINLTIPSTVSDISSFLQYNGTAYAADSDCDNADCYISSSLDIPLMDTTDAFELNPFYWVITTLTGSITSTLTTDTENQNVSLINFSKCGAGHSAVLFNISNEADNTPLTADFGATFKYYIGDGTVIKTETTSQSAAASYDYCISPNETYIVSSTILVEATGFELRNFDFNKITYDNLSQVVQPLRLINGTAHTVSNIIIEVTDSGLAPLEGVLVNISRYFPASNSYLLVESKLTDEFGQFVAKLIEDDVRYRFKFYNAAGTLLKTSDLLTIACRATYCVLPFVIEGEVDDLERFEDINDYNSPGITFNNVTNTVTYFFDDQTGNGATTLFRVIRYNFNESSIVCANTTTSTLTTLVCGVGDSTASYIAQVYRTVDGETRRLEVLDFKVGGDFSIYGMEGLLWVFILLFTCIGIGAFNPSVGIGLYGVAFVMMGIIGIISMPLTVFFANTMLCVLFIWGVNK